MKDPELLRLVAAVERGDVTTLAEHLQAQEKVDGVMIPLGCSGEHFLLHEAARSGQVGVARWLLDHGMHINALNSRGCTPLHCACSGGHVELAQVLLEHGADISTGERDTSKTPLHHACSTGNIEMVRLLLAHEADVHVKDQYSNTPHLVIRQGQKMLAILSLLLERGANLNEQGQLGSTLLLDACIRKCIDLVRFCLQQGADVTLRRTGEFDKKTALHFCWDVDSARLLLDHGADISAQNWCGRTVLHRMARRAEKSDVIQFLLNRGAHPDVGDSEGITALFEACYSGQLENARILLERGANVNATDCCGETALSRNCLHQISLATLLLEHGADPNIQGTDGNTALHCADDAKIVDLLLQHGAGVHLRNNRGETPLYSCFPTPRIVTALLSNGADVNAKDNAGVPFLHQIVFSAHSTPLLLDTLLQNNVDLNAVDKAGSTALHALVRSVSSRIGENNIDWSRCLLQAGADQTIRNNKGDIPLHIACAAQFRWKSEVTSFHEFIRCLIEKQPCVVTILNQNGFLPFHLAILNDDTPLETLYILLRMNPIESIQSWSKEKEVNHSY